jgi:hypothetical protein
MHQSNKIHLNLSSRQKTSNRHVAGLPAAAMSHQFPASEIADRALLLATLPSLDTPHFLAPVIQAATTSTRHRLVIVLFSRLFNHPLPLSPTTFRGVSHTERWDDVHRLLIYVYVQATKVAQDLDKVLMDVDVLLLGIDGEAPEDLGVGMDIVFRVAGGASLICSMTTLY